ncbi:hypothetical protein BC938DRAFT_477932 [Jimgerdemannia flammicorona]|uniref:Uncharacterized protein n=1 Tax=Jimgerdemannia flammicorona TaxID=994334 RepID=A0A433QYP9_9FUNG|nr:hypothetical protein BC938DRAFT_477932 [Jimgerdemannia flammicorona]
MANVFCKDEEGWFSSRSCFRRPPAATDGVRWTGKYMYYLLTFSMMVALAQRLPALSISSRSKRPLLSLVHFEHVATNLTGSRLLSMYWFFVGITNAIKLRTWILMGKDITQISLNTTLLSLSAALLLLDQLRTDHIDWTKTAKGPVAGASPVSILTVSWVSDLIKRAYKADLDFSDLWCEIISVLDRQHWVEFECELNLSGLFLRSLPDHMSTKTNYLRFEKEWNKELKKNKPSLILTLFRVERINQPNDKETNRNKYKPPEAVDIESSDLSNAATKSSQCLADIHC